LFADEREKAEQARRLRDLLGVDMPSHRSPARVSKKKIRRREKAYEEFDDDAIANEIAGKDLISSLFSSIVSDD
jgi:hypothetical protein